MYKIKTSPGSFSRAGLFGGLFLLYIILAGYPSEVYAQEFPDFAKPFKKCWNYGTSNGMSHIIASDNDKQIIVSNNSSSVISIDPLTKLENWKSEISGQIAQPAITDDNTLFLLVRHESGSGSDKTGKIFTLSSLSLKTGITKWQEKIVGGNEEAEIKPADNKEVIFIKIDRITLLAIQKANGEILWKKSFSAPIISLGSMSETEIRVLTENDLSRIKVDTGEIFKEIKFKNTSSKNSVLEENYLLSGASTGEIRKIVYGEGKSHVAWKVKTGGSISSLITLKEGILAASLDNFIYLYSTEDGKLKWKRRVSGRVIRTPLIFKNYAVVINSADNFSSVIDLRDGRVVNQIKIEDDNYFSGSPMLFKNFLTFQSYRGIYFFGNADANC